MDNDPLTDRDMKVMDDLERSAEEVRDIRDFLKFLSKTTEAYQQGILERQDTYDYLEGLIGVTWSVAKGNHPDVQGGPETEAEWSLFAQFLLTAFSHS